MTASPGALRMAEISAPPVLAAHARDIAVQTAEALVALQKPDGHFVFELEADATLPSEYILNRFLGVTEPARGRGLPPISARSRARATAGGRSTMAASSTCPARSRPIMR